MNPVHLYDYLVKARAELFDWVRPLPASSYQAVFPYGMASLSRTLPHILNAEWVYVQRMQSLDVGASRPVDADNPPPFPSLESVWTTQAERTRAALARIPDWNRTIEYRRDWEGQMMVFSATPADFFSQLLMHEVHHRAQAMSMLRQLGVAAQDLDYSILMIPRRPA